MGKVEDYREKLKKMKDWDTFLMDESCLPGPRANLELVEAVAKEGDLQLFTRYLKYDEEIAPYGSELEILPVCGVVGLGRLVSEGNLNLLKTLRLFASDSRWRVREGVVMGLQQYGEVDMDALLQEMERWGEGNLLERRAAIAALCEPKLLKSPEVALRVLGFLNQITNTILHEEDRKSEKFRVLRKALGYCWSVAVVAAPEAGKKIMEEWFLSPDKDVRWIMKENLKKNRLQKLDREWTGKWLCE